MSKLEGSLGFSDYDLFAPASRVLTDRGWTQAELQPLFSAMEVDKIEDQGSVVLIKGRTVDFVLFVLRGAVSHGPKRHQPGDVVGAAPALSGQPVMDDARTEQNGTILGQLSLKRLEQLGSDDSQPTLARKVSS